MENFYKLCELVDNKMLKVLIDSGVAEQFDDKCMEKLLNGKVVIDKDIEELVKKYPSKFNDNCWVILTESSIKIEFFIQYVDKLDDQCLINLCSMHCNDEKFLEFYEKHCVCNDDECEDACDDAIVTNSGIETLKEFCKKYSDRVNLKCLCKNKNISSEDIVELCEMVAKL